MKHKKLNRQPRIACAAAPYSEYQVSVNPPITIALRILER